MNEIWRQLSELLVESLEELFFIKEKEYFCILSFQSLGGGIKARGGRDAQRGCLWDLQRYAPSF